MIYHGGPVITDVLMWQAVDMDDIHIKSSGLKVLVNKNIFTDTTSNFVLFSSLISHSKRTERL